MFDLHLDFFSRVRELWPRERFLELGLPGYAVPKGHGGLPVGENFERFEVVARCWMESALLFGYGDLPLPSGASVVIFTWVMPDGLGDWSAQHTVATILKMAMPNLQIELITLVEVNEKRFLSHPDFSAQVLSYSKNDPAYFSSGLIRKLAGASLILQTPTYYPHFEALYEQVKAASYGAYPSCAHVGEYGFINSEWFHPESGNMCMGLHSLEKGLLLHAEISSIDISPVTPFYFAYLVTERGYAIYFHSLLKYKINNTSDIEIVVCNLLAALYAIKNEVWSDYGLKEIIIRDEKNETTISIADSGKRVIIICKTGLSSLDVQKLYLSSENFVGCRGDRSFSETISLDKVFFYDAPIHSLPFLKDLYNVSYFYCLAYPSLHSYLKCLLDKTSPAKLVGNQIAEILFDPSFLCGMKKLFTLLKSDFLFNPTLVNLVKSRIYQHFHPSLKKMEETLFKEFIEGAHSLESIIWKKNLTVL